jgi:hypothetical protein
MTLRASEIARPIIGGAMSEHAFRSRRVTTTADLECAMREQRTTALRASEIVRPIIGGAMSEHAFRSRRVTTTADLECAMREQRTTLSRRKKLRRFSRVTEQCPDNISDVLSCLRLATLAAENTACITKMRHSLEAPLRVDRGVLATPAKRMPAT